MHKSLRLSRMYGPHWQDHHRSQSVIKFNGRRGAFLLLFGILYLVMATALRLPRPIPNASPFLHDLIPLMLQSMIWLICGVNACVCAFIRLSKATVFGYALLSFPLGLRVISYSISWIILDVDIRIMVTGLVAYGALLTAVLIVASWPEPNPVKIKSILPPDERGWKRRWR